MTITAIDYESFLVSNEAPIPKAVCLSYAVEQKSGLHVGMDNMEMFMGQLLESDSIIVSHNATFELLVTYQNFPKLRELLWKSLEAGRWYCTQLGQQLLNNVSKKQVVGMSLADLVKHYKKLDISATKTDPDAWRLRYSELDGVPLENWPEAAVKYAIDDSIFALQIYHFQTRQRATHGTKYQLVNTNVMKEHIKASFALNLMATRGLLVDKDRVNVLSEEVDAILKPYQDKLESLGFMTRTKKGTLTKNSKQLRDYIGANFKELRYTESGEVSIARNSLDAYLLEKEDEILESFMKMGVYEKAKSTYINRLKQADPVIRSSYNAIVSSGRTSSRASSAYPSVNIQNQPRELKDVTWDIRNCYIPRPGYKLVSIDYNNLELLAVGVSLYNIYGRSAMLDLINRGDVPTDLHSVFACKLMSADIGREVTYEEFMKNKKDKEYKKYRDKGKPVTLGSPAGMGCDTIGLQFIQAGIRLKYEVICEVDSEYKARSIIKKYQSETPNIRVKQVGFRKYAVVYDEIVGIRKLLYEIYPELEMFLRSGHEKYLNGESRWIKDEFGQWQEEPFYRYVSFGVERNYCSYTAMCNGRNMQTPSAVGAKNVAYKLVRKFESDDSVHVLCFIHDEFIFEIKDDDKLYDNVGICAEIMIDGMQEVLPGARVAVESSIMNYWSKSVTEWDKVYFKNANDKELRSV